MYKYIQWVREGEWERGVVEKIKEEKAEILLVIAVVVEKMQMDCNFHCRWRAKELKCRGEMNVLVVSLTLSFI